MPSPSTTPSTPIRRALLSVTDKAGLIDFARGLISHAIEIISTGGTAQLLKSAGLPVTPIEQVTGFPEIMHGRVKTLHPKVHGGLLGLRDHPEHIEAMARHEILPIDLVCVNLYAFEQTIAAPGCTRENAIENIDIGGPSMIRSAAKNHAYVAVVTDAADYAPILAELAEHKGATTLLTRQKLAAKAFALTAKYDSAIASYLLSEGGAHAYPQLLTICGDKVADLRYGENPHQSAALYARAEGSVHVPSIVRAVQLHGKQLSYNNINDAAAALDLVVTLKHMNLGIAGACCVKHCNPCGAAIVLPGSHAACLAVIDEAIAGDPIAAFGGIIAVNIPIDAAAADRLCERDVFLEVLIAPSYAPEALEKLRSRWANLRILAVGDISADARNASTDLELRSITGGLLVQQRDTRYARPEECKHVAGPVAAEVLGTTAQFLEVVGGFLLSNAIIIGGPSPNPARARSVIRMFGAGAGQMDRVTACRLAAEKAGGLAKGAAAYSDAFFPFSDGPTILADVGIKLIMHPGGSKRDQDTFDLCNQRDISCILSGLRHFRH